MENRERQVHSTFCHVSFIQNTFFSITVWIIKSKRSTKLILNCMYFHKFNSKLICDISLRLNNGSQTTTTHFHPSFYFASLFSIWRAHSYLPVKFKPTIYEVPPEKYFPVPPLLRLLNIGEQYFGQIQFAHSYCVWAKPKL
jgi:hypothetical protein